MGLVESKISNSFKWSTVTELFVKIITPILNIILAHILLPEAFAPLATINLVITFGEVFVESGFRKFLIQHDFEDSKQQKKYYDVAFWASLIFSFFMWGLMIVFCKPIATYLGSSDIWLAIAISGVILPLYSVCGIFNSCLQKELKFKKMFVVRIVAALIPLFVTIPLALFGLDYWALVIGNIVGVLGQAIALFWVSEIKIGAFFSFEVLKDMLSYASWTLLDGMAIWLTSWIDSFIIARYMTEYYLGLYKNSMSMINSLSGIVTSAIVPVLFVGLSKYQHDNTKFSNLYNAVQRLLAMILIPMGVGCLIYSDFLVDILFGSEWSEAAGIVGIVAITTSFRTVYVGLCSDAYRAKGLFKIPFFLQIIDLFVLVPVCLISAKKGFWALVYARSLIKLDLIIPEIVIMNRVLKIELKEQFVKSIPIYISTIVMGAFCILTRDIFDSMIWYFFDIIFAIIVYSGSILLFPSTRQDILSSPFFGWSKKNK